MKIRINLLLIVSLMALLSCNNEDSDVLSTACFDFTPGTGKVGDEFKFSNCSENSTSFFWYFGDGNTSQQKEPDHTYLKGGTYTIKLLAGKDINADGVLNHHDSYDSITKDITVAPNHKSLELTIRDATTWTITNTSCDEVIGADFKLYSSKSAFDAGTPAYSLKSDNSGKILIYDLEAGNYLMTITKNDLSNLKDGYLILGVFQNQAEVDAYIDIQTGATVGGIKLADMNQDGVIDPKDKTIGDDFSISSDDTITQDVYIGK